MSIRPTIMEVDISAFKHNIDKIKEYVGDKEIMPVIKANAYGTYINKYLPAIKDFDIVAIATVDEAKDLRKLGFKNTIFLLNQPDILEIDKITKYHITIGLSSTEFLEELTKKKNKMKVHLEIETGMNRTGIALEQLPKYLSMIKNCKNMEVEGIYTHLSSADSDINYTKKQLEIFKKAVEIAKEAIPTIHYVHALSTNGIINYLSDITNLVRPGIMMYGYDSFEGATKKLNLKPVCKLKSKITFLKEVPKKTAISYSKTYITKKKTKIATIPIGYADGIRRCLSNKGYVLINNQRCRIIGNICMDSLMADVTELEDVKVGDTVYLWDNENIKVEEIASLCHTINYEILSTISARVPRVFNAR